MSTSTPPTRSESRRHHPVRTSKLALTLSLFYLSSLASASFTPRSWRPDTELPGAPFRLGDGKNEGTKVIGYEGEWPLWSSFRSKPSSPSLDATAGAPSSSNGTYVCAPIGDCTACPDDVKHLPYCRPYNNRRRVACSPVSNPKDPASVQSALASASNSSSTALLGYEACGKSARQEARDYFEMIAVIASIAIFSVWAFVQRQKLLFQRQNQTLYSRVTGGGGWAGGLQRRSSGLPPTSGTSANGTVGTVGNNRKRAAKLAVPSRM